MMTFDEMWALFDLGDELRVYDGAPIPGSDAAHELRHWQSRNHVGRLAARSTEGQRWLDVEVVNDLGNIVAYRTVEGDGKLFDCTESSPLPAQQAVAIQEINAEASRRILSAYPDWKQRNDALDVDAPGRAERIAEKDAVVAWSNGLTARIRSATDATSVADILSELNDETLKGGRNG